MTCSNLVKVQIAASVVALVAGGWLVARRAAAGNPRAATAANTAETARADRLTAQLAQESARLAEARSRAETLEQALAKAAEDIDTVKIQRGQAEARAAALQGQVDRDTKDEADRLAALQKRLEQAAKDHAAQLAEARGQADTLQRTCAGLTGDIESLRAERKQSQVRIAELQQRLDQAAKVEADRLADARRRSDVLQRVMANLTRDLEAIQAERGQADAYAAELQAQLTEASKSLGGAPQWLPGLLSEARRRATALAQLSANLAINLEAVRAERRQAEAAAVVTQARLDHLAKLQAVPPEWLIGLLDRR